jgi:AcrR family transcriptional regulator
VNSAPPSRRALTKGQRTRERLLRAAIDRFGAHGYRGTSVSQLSRDAGLTPAAAYAYFADKDAFWAAAIEADLDELDGEIRDKALATEQPVFNLMAGLFRGLDHHALTRRVLAEGDPDDLQLVLRHRIFAQTTQQIRRILAVRKDAGLLPGNGDPAMLAMGIETVMFALIVSSVRAGMADDLDRVWAVVEVLRSSVGGPPSETEIPR